MNGNRITAWLLCTAIAIPVLFTGSGRATAERVGPILPAGHLESSTYAQIMVLQNEPDAAPSPTPESDPRPELSLSVPDSKGSVGGPVLLTVRLRNEGAMRAARNAALVSQYESLGMDPEREAMRAGRPLRTEEEKEVQAFSLSSDWREQVTFEIAGIEGNNPFEPGLLSSTAHTPTEIGIIPLQTTLAISPETTREMATGTYTVTARLDPAGLFPELDLPDGEEIAGSVTFSLGEPASDAEQAIMEETVSLYYVRMLDCESAIPSAMEAIRLDPHRYSAYWYAAQCQAALGNTGEAIALLETLLDIMPPMKDGGEFYAGAKAWLAQLKK